MENEKTSPAGAADSREFCLEKKTDVTDIYEKAGELVELMKDCDVYQRYHKCLHVLKSDEARYGKFNEFRQKNILIETEQGDDYYHKVSALYAEYNDLLLERAVSEYLSAEQQMNRMLKKVYDQISEAAQMDLSYFD